MRGFLIPPKAPSMPTAGMDGMLLDLRLPLRYANFAIGQAQLPSLTGIEIPMEIIDKAATKKFVIIFGTTLYAKI